MEAATVFLNLWNEDLMIYFCNVLPPCPPTCRTEHTVGAYYTLTSLLTKKRNCGSNIEENSKAIRLIG